MKSSTARQLNGAILVMALTGLAPAAMCTPARAGTNVDLRAGVYTDADAIALGGGLLTRLGSYPGWYLNPNVEVAMPDRGSVVALNADVHYDFQVTGTMSPYLGAGPTLFHRDPDRGDGRTDLGLNLVAGLASLRGDARPFVQLKGVFADQHELALMGGVRF